MMQYIIAPLLEILNPTNTVSRNRLLSFAIGNAEAKIYNCLIAKHVYYNNLGKLFEGGWFYSTVMDLHLSSGYAEDAQRNAIRHLIKHGLIESELKGIPAKRFFRIIPDVDKLNSLINSGEEIQQAIAQRYKDDIEKRSQRRKNTKRKYIEVTEDSIHECPAAESSDTIKKDTTPETSSENVMETASDSAQSVDAACNVDCGDSSQVGDPDSYIGSIGACDACEINQPFYDTVSCSPEYRETSSPYIGMETKDKINQRNFFEYQSFNPSASVEKFSAVERTNDGVMKRQSISFLNILEMLGFDTEECEHYFGFVPKCEADLYEFSDEDRISARLTLPEAFRCDRKALIAALKFLCGYSYYGTPDSSVRRFMDITLGMMADLVVADSFKFNDASVSYADVIDTINEIVHEHSLYEFIIDFYYEWEKILRENVKIRNRTSYMKTCMWNWMKQWKIEEYNMLAELE